MRKLKAAALAKCEADKLQRTAWEAAAQEAAGRHEAARSLQVNVLGAVYSCSLRVSLLEMARGSWHRGHGTGVMRALACD